MKARTLFSLLGYLVIGAGIATLLIRFIAGDMGIIETGRKQRIIAGLKADIALLKNSGGEKQAEIERLENDRDVIRSYALLYGMVGGMRSRATQTQSSRDTSPPTEEAAAREHREATDQLQETGAIPFLLRHPILLILLIAIALTGIGLVMRERFSIRARSSC